MQVIRRPELWVDGEFLLALGCSRDTNRVPPLLEAFDVAREFRRARIGHLRTLFIAHARVQVRGFLTCQVERGLLIFEHRFANDRPMAKIRYQAKFRKMVQVGRRHFGMKKQAPSVSLECHRDLRRLANPQRALEERTPAIESPVIFTGMNGQLLGVRLLRRVEGSRKLLGLEREGHADIAKPVIARELGEFARIGGQRRLETVISRRGDLGELSRRIILHSPQSLEHSDAHVGLFYVVSALRDGIRRRSSWLFLVGLALASVAGGCTPRKAPEGGAQAGQTKVVRKDPAGPRLEPPPNQRMQTTLGGVRVSLVKGYQAAGATQKELSELISSDDLMLAKCAIYEAYVRRDLALLPSLIKRLRDKSGRTPDDVAAFVVYALGAFRTYETDRVILDATKDSRKRVRVMAGLTKPSAKEAVAPLLELVRDPSLPPADAESRTVLITSSQVCAEPIDGDAVPSLDGQLFWATDALVRHGRTKEVLPTLRRIAYDPAPRTFPGQEDFTDKARELLASLKDPEGARLAEAEAQRNPTDLSIQYLSRYDGPQVAKRLLAIGSDPRLEVRTRRFALTLLNPRTSYPELIPELIALLGSPEPLIRGGAAVALAATRDPRAGEALDKALEDEKSARVRAEIEAARLAYAAALRARNQEDAASDGAD